MKHYLMFDMGTGNSRVCLVDSCGKVLGIKRFDNKYYRDDSYDDGQYFIPERWSEKLIKGCYELCKEHPEIKVNGISAAAARQSFVLIDRCGKAFLGLPNIDNRGKAFINDIGHAEEIYKRSGKWLTEDFGAGKLLGLKVKHPEEFNKIYKITSLSEWMGYIFTGKCSIEPSHASESQLYDLMTKSWSEDICSWYDYDKDILPELVPGGSILGPVDREYAGALNLDEDAVFIVGGADTQIAIRQTGIKAGEIAIVSGTTSPVVTLKDEFFYDPEQRVWVESNVSGDNYQIEMNPGVTGLNYQNMKKLLCPDKSYDELEEEYSGIKEVKCTASFTSLLFYEKRGLRNGGFFMRSPLQDNVTAADLMYSILGDIACATYEELKRLVEITGNDPDFLLGCGGGFQSETLCRMVSSLSGKPLKLKKGFGQATVQGLVSICNEALGETSGEEEEYLLFTPEEDNLIFKYYPVWKKNRDKVNDCK